MKKSYKSELCAVVIPVYKMKPDPNEQKSFVQCLRILGKHQIIVICSSNFDCSYYTDLAFKNFHIVINVKRFDNFYFSGIEGYSTLMLKSEFYSSFSEYKYMLIYQLDCYVFKDELFYWCSQGYDYIGAPWSKSDTEYLYYEELINRIPSKFKHNTILRKFFNKLNKVGNGGFSLRNVSKHLNYTEKYKNTAQNWFPSLEDTFWSIFIKYSEPQYRIPSVSVAARFSIETNPVYFFKKNGSTVPFGVHGYLKYQSGFWKNKLECEL